VARHTKAEIFNSIADAVGEELSSKYMKGIIDS
jgi:hypothetical protein